MSTKWYRVEVRRRGLKWQWHLVGAYSSIPVSQYGYGLTKWSAAAKGQRKWFKITEPDPAWITMIEDQWA